MKCFIFSVCLARPVYGGTLKNLVHFLSEGGLRTPRSTLAGLLSVRGGLLCFRNEAFFGLRPLDVEAQAAGTPGV